MLRNAAKCCEFFLVFSKSITYITELVVLDLEFFIFSDFTAHTFGEKLREDIFISVVVFIARLCEI